MLAKFRTGTARPLLEFHEALLRGDSPFTVAEREMMAAYVSGLNACRYCLGAHAAVARAFGVPELLMHDLLTEPERAAIEPRWLPLLRFLRTLTLTPARMTQAAADAVYAAGWTERALYDAIQVCCLFNFMNRFVEGVGLAVVPDQFEAQGRRIRESGYVGMIASFGIGEEDD